MDIFPDVYSPERDLSFDEAICAWKGNLRFKVYNPAKPTRFVFQGALYANMVFSPCAAWIRIQ
jgi:hypothetical protein